MSTPAPPPAEPPVGPAAEPVCPRHPDRVSYVRCQRCERPVCPECQRQASVGVQCVDCVREQAKSVRAARTVFGGQVRDGRPVVTFTLIGVCIGVYVLQLLIPGFTNAFSFTVDQARDEPWRFVTSAFLHSPGLPLHIAFNMIVLYQVGPYLESLLGRVRFLALYMVCAVGGSVGYLLLAPRPSIGVASADVVGASGAVFGLFGALLVLQRRLGQETGGVLVFIGINFALGFIVPNVAWQSHLADR